MGNARFSQKATYDYLRNIVGSDAFLMWAFQQNNGGLTVDDEAGHGASGAITLSSDTMWSGQGWYQSFGRPLQGGMKGYGLANTGGASALVGTVPDNSLTNLNGKSKFTIVLKVLMSSTGGGGFGQLVNKLGALQLYATGANQFDALIWDGAAYRGTRTLGVVYGYWHDLTIVYDGTLVGDTNRLKIYLNGSNTTILSVAGVPATISDSSNILNMMNSFAANRAWDGRLGFAAYIPDVAFTQSQIQGLIELRSLDQPTAANQPTIQVPGAFGAAQYDFDGAADPNSDYLAAFQIQTIKSNTGTIVIFFGEDDFTTDQNLIGICTNGFSDDEFLIEFLGTIAGDPIRILAVDAAVTTYQNRTPTNIINPSINMITFISDGSTNTFYYGGIQGTLTPTFGVNTGQWFSGATNANIITIGAIRRATLTRPFNGKQSKILIYDRPLTQIEIQKIYASGPHAGGPAKWYPES